jgi:hypothetical protein
LQYQLVAIEGIPQGCDSSLLVARKAPVGVLGNEAILVANKMRHFAFEAVSGESRKQDHGDARQFEQSCRSWA